MENLQALYQQRLNSLARSFLGMLQQFEKLASPFSDATLSQHRIEYLEHIITKTLQNDRQKFVKQLFDEIAYLKGKIQQKMQPVCQQMSMFCKEFSGTSTCSRESEEEKEAKNVKFLSPYFHGYKKSRTRVRSKMNETQFDEDTSMIGFAVTSGIKKKQIFKEERNANAGKQKMLQPLAQSEEFFAFKYLRFEKC